MSTLWTLARNLSAIWGAASATGVLWFYVTDPLGWRLAMLWLGL